MNRACKARSRPWKRGSDASSTPERMALAVTYRQRRTITAIFLVFAVLGAVIRAVTDKGTTAHDVGTLLLVMWLPIVGNIVGWLMGLFRSRKPPKPGGFDAARPFTPTLQARLERVDLPG